MFSLEALFIMFFFGIEAGIYLHRHTVLSQQEPFSSNYEGGLECCFIRLLLVLFKKHSIPKAQHFAKMMHEAETEMVYFFKG